MKQKEQKKQPKLKLKLEQVFVVVLILLFVVSMTLLKVNHEKKKISDENAEYLSVIEEYSVEYSALENEIETYKNEIEDYESQIEDCESQIENYKAQIKEYKEKLETTTAVTTTVVATTTQTAVSDNNFGVFKSYTDYRCLSRSSKQWQLQEQAYTDENGLRKIDDAYLVALGSYYGTILGTRYTVTLSNGSVFDIILCDCKQDIHTDNKNQECLVNGSVLEFYVDSSVLPQKVKTLGTVGAIPYFSGSVVSIVKK